MKAGLGILMIFLSTISTIPNTKGNTPVSRDDQIAQAATAMRDKLVQTRRYLHAHPELSNREVNTGKFVADRLREIGLTDIRTNVARNGVVALLKGGKPGPVVAVRADIDALPIQEMHDFDFKSQNPGVMHACGHDAHTTIELGVAELLMKMRDQIPGTIKFIFQPAEEGPPEDEEGGAPLMVKEGALENPKPNAIFGLHVMPTLEVGTIGYNSGPAMATADRFVITLKGKKVHGAYPHQGVDTVVIAAEAVSALQKIRSRRIDTQEPMVLTIGSIHGGNRFNIIADEVVMEGTLRTLNEDVRKQVHKMIEQTLSGVTEEYGATYTFKIKELAALTYNDPKLVEQTLPTMKRIMGNDNVLNPKPQMGAEDFSYYERVVPGFFYFLGVANQKKGITAMIHTPEFDLDEDALVIGVKLMSGVLLDYMEHGGK
ncbi:MAG TPA: amidohydrolase [Blastocatellia bacterium]|nr:amidohydrolase [Blastocatellia bacterium]